MITVAILSFMFFFLSALFKSEMDTIKFRPSQAVFQSDWWLNNNWAGHSWIRKTIFSFTLDGWHLCETLRVFSNALPVAMICAVVFILPDVSFYITSVIYAVILYTIHGIVFELGYNY